MRGRHHAICGAAVAAPALLYLTRGSIGAVVVGVPIATLGAMLPDIDTRRFPLQGEVWRAWKRLAKTARSRGPLGMPFALAAILVGALMAGALGALSWLVRRVVSHRGFTHTVFCTAIIGVAATWASLRLVGSWVPGVALAIGYASHLGMRGTSTCLRIANPWGPHAEARKSPASWFDRPAMRQNGRDLARRPSAQPIPSSC